MSATHDPKTTMTDTPATDAAIRATVTGLIDAHGADLSRWPEDGRARLNALLHTSPVARRAWAEAQALEAMLAAPRPVVDAARLDALQDRVMAAIDAEQPASKRVVNLADARQALRGAKVEAGKSPALLSWRAGLALAASLVIGVLTGLSDGPGPLSASSFGELVSGSNDEVALSDDAVTADVEDYL
jgi:hypothetical protein